MHEEESDQIIITDEEAGERLDKILAKRFANVYSRTYFQYLIEEKLVLVNGIPVKKRLQPQPGDEIEIEFAITPELSLTPENIPLDILYEDEHLLAVNKPAGMVVHPAPGNWSGTFVNALIYHCQNLSLIGNPLRPGIVHRLDKDTSGVIIAAKTSQMQHQLIDLFAQRQVYKEYLAVCIGKPPEGEVSAPIGRHPVHRKEMAIVPQGKPAVSFFTPIAWNNKLSLVKVVITTGRTHQIRVHLKHLGMPVLGDQVYGQAYTNKKYAISRQLLHASVVRLEHPISREKLEFKAPLPADMIDIVGQIQAEKIS